MRIKIIRLMVIAGFVLILCGLGYTQILKGKYYFRLSRHNRIRVVPLESWRGRILDRNGIVLADNQVAYRAMVTPQDIQDRERLFRFLSDILDVEYEDLLHRYQTRKFTPFAPVIIEDHLTRDQAIVLQENKYRFPSLFVQESFVRIYPLKENSAHVVGYLGKSSYSPEEHFQKYGYTPNRFVGQMGIEKFYDSLLIGEGGGIQIEVDSRGRQVRLLSMKESVTGQDVTLTLDTQLQAWLAEVLEGHIGGAVMMDAKTGEILGMVSSPSFDLNFFVNPKYSKQLSRILTDSSAIVLNRTVKAVYPPGSVFKIPVSIAALQTKKITPHTAFDCPGYYELGEHRFGCTYAHGSQNMYEAISHSCNVYFYHLGKILGSEVISKYAHELGLGRLTYIDLPFEKIGRVPDRRSRFSESRRPWYTGDTLNLSIGQGDVLTNPLQLTRMMATISQDGVEVQPHFLKAVGGVEENRSFVTQKLSIDDTVLREVKKGLRATVTNYSGTAHELDIRGVHIAGKTGTAQSSPGKPHHAWFAGYLLGKNKDLAFCFFIEHGGSSHNSVRLAREVIEKMNKAEMF